MLKQKVEKILEKYPAATYRNRKQHIVVKEKDSDNLTIQANTRTVPGIITNRGCCFAGCKGVVLGPLRDVVHIVHGPIGCSYYSWGVRRHKGRSTQGEQNLLSYCFSTDMQEGDIVFGGVNKLREAIKEAVEIFKPEAITICATCPIGLIGDDIDAVAKEAQKQYGIPVLAFHCEGYKGVSQSAGHHIANNGLMQHVVGTDDDREVSEYSINILGEYNIGGDAWEVDRILEKIGYYEIVAMMTGNGTFRDLKSAHKANLNIVQCHRSINYIADMLKVKYGTDWLKINFIGIQSTIDSLRNMAKYFGDKDLIEKTEEVIREELNEIMPIIEEYKKKLKGKTAMLFVGGSRAHHYQNLFKDIGMETVLAGYEFAHRDDYEGREVLPFIKEDADSKNIEELYVEPDPKHYRLFLSKERFEQLKNEIPLNYYAGMIREMKDGTIIVDDLNHYETEEFIKLLKPDIFCSGIKDKYIAHKMGIFSKQLHSYDYGGPYAGFKGAVNFARDVANGILNPGWKLATPPWKKEPEIEAQVAWLFEEVE